MRSWGGGLDGLFGRGAAGAVGPGQKASAAGTSGRGGADGGGCAGADLPPFPWPSPPQPSGSATVPPYLLFGSAGRAPSTLLDVASRLEAATARAGYRQLRYLAAGCDGVALVLDLERIGESGARLRGAAGFAPPNQREPFELTAYVRRLFHAPPGHYRQIVFVVSDQPIGYPTPPPTAAGLRAIARDGWSGLPRPYSTVAYTPRHVVHALIYEFEKGPRDGDAQVVAPDGRLGATVHLTAAGLF